MGNLEVLFLGVIPPADARVEPQLGPSWVPNLHGKGFLRHVQHGSKGLKMRAKSAPNKGRGCRALARGWEIVATKKKAVHQLPCE